MRRTGYSMSCLAVMLGLAASPLQVWACADSSAPSEAEVRALVAQVEQAMLSQSLSLLEETIATQMAMYVGGQMDGEAVSMQFDRESYLSMMRATFAEYTTDRLESFTYETKILAISEPLPDEPARAVRFEFSDYSKFHSGEEVYGVGLDESIIICESGRAVASLINVTLNGETRNDTSY